MKLVAIGVCDIFIKRNDIHDFMPIIEKIKQQYDK